MHSPQASRVLPRVTFSRRGRNWYERVFRGMEPWKGLLDRRPHSIEKVAAKVAKIFDIPLVEAECEAKRICDGLHEAGYLVCGNQIEMVDGGTTCEEIFNANRGLDAPSERSLKDGEQNGERPNEPAMDLLIEYFREHPAPFELCMDLTRSCTERCVHCYVPGFESVHLNLDLIRKVFTEFGDAGGLKVKLTGGECMLHPHFKTILRLARAHDFVISVLSNLTMCDDAMVRALRDTNVAVVQVSLYGATAEYHEAVTRIRGSFNRTISAIRRLRGAGVPVQIHCPVMKQNLQGIMGVKKLGEELRIKTTFDASIMSRADHEDCGRIECGLSDVELKQYLAEYDNPERIEKAPGFDCKCSPCEIGLHKICLSANGEYYPCNGCYQYTLGKASEKTLMEVWQSAEMRRLRELTIGDMKTCASCDMIQYCEVCPSRNFNATCNLCVPDSGLCRMAKIRKELAEER